MKIALIQPPIRDFYITQIRMTPLGLLYLAGVLKQRGHNVILIDAISSQTRKTILIPKEISYLKKYYIAGDKSPFRLFGSYYHFGMDYNQIRERIKEEKADVYCISMLMTPYHKEAEKIAEIVKEEFPEATTIVGGGHATLEPLSVLNNPSIDYVVLGEGEEILPALIKIIEENDFPKLHSLKSIGFKQNGKIFVNEFSSIVNVDETPFPAREIMGENFYKADDKRITPILFSRGCPHRCIYCSVPIIFGNKYRIRNPKAVIDEIVECGRRFNIEIFDFEDDNLTFQRETAIELFNGIKKYFPREGQIECRAMNGLTASSLDEELLIKMRSAHFKSLNLALITTDESLQNKWKRPFNSECFSNVVKMGFNIGFNITGYQIVGIPGQTLNEMIETFLFLKSLPIKIGVSIFYPIPQTPIFDVCVENKYIQKDDFISFRSSAIPVETDEFSRDDLFTFLVAARIHNFLTEHPSIFGGQNNFNYSIKENTNPEKLISLYPLSFEDIGKIVLRLWREKRKVYAVCKAKKQIQEEERGNFQIVKDNQISYQYDLIELPVVKNLLDRLL